ncbi:MAG: hypothetical protein ACC726_02365 [Chloroflexota bacterium]
MPFEAGLRDPYGASHITAVAAGPKGIVAIGLSPTGAAAWHSVDGLSWTRAIPPRSWTKTGQFGWYPTLADVVAMDAGFVAVGIEHDGPRRTYRNTGSVWTSEDGRIWRRSARGVGPYLRKVIEQDGRLYAISGEVSGRLQSAIWASDDAIDWERVYVSPEDTSVAVIASDDAVIVAGDGQTMVYSLDGRTWHDAPIEHHPDEYWLEDATAFDGGFIAVGARSRGGAAWSSVDGRSWRVVPATAHAGGWITHFAAVAAQPAGGVILAANTDEFEGWLYRSEDGTSWGEPVFGEPVFGVPGVDLPFTDIPFTDVAAYGDRSYLVGYHPDDPRGVSAAVWTTPAPEADSTDDGAITSCPGPRPTLAELVEMDPASRLRCFGDRELTFRALLKQHQTGDVEYYGQPLWLTAGLWGARALPVDGDRYTTMSLLLHADPRPRRRLALPFGRWAHVTGHFDDRAARKCADRWKERCRQAFVVTDVRVDRTR